MMSKNLICRTLSTNGINYVAGDIALPLFDSLESLYTRAIRKRAVWVNDRFGEMTGEDLNRFMQDNWNNWGSEFSRESFARGCRQ